jgi:uncharacterized RDD family membrane protein YckC
MTYGDEPSRFSLSASAATEGKTEPSMNQLEDLPLFGSLEDPEEFEEPTKVEQSAEIDESAEPVQASIEEPWQPEAEAVLPPEPQAVEPELSPQFDFTEVEPVSHPEAAASSEAPSIRPAGLTDRLGAALLDLAVMAGAVIALAGGAALLGATPQLSDWPLLAFPWLLFSFLYHVIPMAFWGQTPGMASMSLTARTLDDRPLSLGQAVRRWLATLGTTVLLGLPSLLALTGRSATDRLSQSATYWKAPVVPSAEL